jgi:hypothetical protein
MWRVLNNRYHCNSYERSIDMIRPRGGDHVDENEDARGHKRQDLDALVVVEAFDAVALLVREVVERALDLVGLDCTVLREERDGRGQRAPDAQCHDRCKKKTQHIWSAYGYSRLLSLSIKGDALSSVTSRGYRALGMTRSFCMASMMYGGSRRTSHTHPQSSECFFYHGEALVYAILSYWAWGARRA